MEGRPIVLGVDGGGSRSESRLWRGSDVVARAAGGALNPNHVGVERSRSNLVALLADLRIASSCGTHPPDAACVGLSGVSHPASRSIVREAFGTAGLELRGPRILVGDSELVLEAAFGEAAASGVALICGTGSIAVARDRAGRLVRAGGEGPERGDAGGGAWIGREAVAAGLVSRGVGEEPPAAAVPAVLDALRRGDPRARALLARAARELAAIARHAASEAGFAGPFEVRACGGVAAASPELVAMLGEELAAGDPPGCVGALVLDPVGGALALASRALARRPDVPPGW